MSRTGARFPWTAVLACLLSFQQELAVADRPGRALDLGFLASSDRTLNDDSRVRVLGPLFEKQVRVDGTFFLAVRPFFSTVRNPAKGLRLNEYLWPAGSSKDSHDENFFRILLFFGNNYELTNAVPHEQYTVFPFLFWGRNSSDERYFAFFPIGGRIDEFLGVDQVDFVLFPLYSHSHAGRSETTDFLWPVFSRTTGEGVSRFRIFPLYGRSSIGDEYDKHFVLWPIWTYAGYNLKDMKGSAYMLWPLYGHSKLTGQETWWFVPPIFKWAEAENYRAINCPWPFFQYMKGKEEKLYLWPLWGHHELGGDVNNFYLWPLIWSSCETRGDKTVSRFDVVPLLFTETATVAKKEGKAPGEEGGQVLERYVKIWPVCSWQSNAKTSRFRTFELWPLKHTAPIERNLTPFWTLYTHTTVGASIEDELLWGLFHYDRNDKGDKDLSLFPVFSWQKSDEGEGFREFNFLLGLAGYKREGLRRTWRLLYFFRFGGDFTNDNP